MITVTAAESPLQQKLYSHDKSTADQRLVSGTFLLDKTYI